MSDNVWVFWSTKDAMNPMQNIKRDTACAKLWVFWFNPLSAIFCSSYMGQFLQGGKNSCFLSLFLFTESLRVAKPY